MQEFNSMCCLLQAPAITVEEASDCSPTEECGLVMPPFRDHTASTGTTRTHTHARMHARTHTHTHTRTHARTDTRISSCSLSEHVWCLSLFLVSESGHEDNEEEGEEVNPAMSAGNYLCMLK